MTVKITKPSINVREELADLRKPTGIAGEAMLRAETPQEQQALIGVGRKNLIFNGDFKVSQRGSYASATSVSNDQYYVDRWSVRLTNVTANIQHILGSNASPNYPYKASNSLRLTATNTATGLLRHLQQVEGFLDGQTLTFSAWVKSNSPNARLFQYQHDGGYRVSSSAHSGNGQWEFLSVTAKNKANSANQLYFDAAIGTSTFGNVSITSGDYIEISEAQMEINKVATPFEHRSYGEELALCQRYFQRLEWKGGNSIVTLQFNNVSGFFSLDYTRKRADPSFGLPTATASTNQANGISFLTSGGSYRGSTGTVTASHISRDSCRINFTSWGSSGSGGDATWAYFTTNTSNPELKCFIDIKAEL
jgi:hypothetical protein